jgi:hypothetical protein
MDMYFIMLMHADVKLYSSSLISEARSLPSRRQAREEAYIKLRSAERRPLTCRECLFFFAVKWPGSGSLPTGS